MARKKQKKSGCLFGIGCLSGIVCLVVIVAFIFGLFAFVGEMPEQAENEVASGNATPQPEAEATQPEREGRLLAKWDYGEISFQPVTVQLKMDREGNLFLNFWPEYTEKLNEEPVYRESHYDHETRRLDWDKYHSEWGIIEPDGDLLVMDEFGGTPETWPAIGNVELPPKRPFRDWTDDTGSFTVRAALESASSSKITLVKPDGSKIAISPERLSEKDRQYVESLRK